MKVPKSLLGIGCFTFMQYLNIRWKLYSEEDKVTLKALRKS